ncbi:hypothetical protein [Nocardioides sp.]|uniref:hypothetical protein n=1 Tax=Nocardioides sp. TaxID=35761 RepID=UPI003563D115
MSEETPRLANESQVWSVAYDSETPSMDGSRHTIRMAEQTHEQALRNFFVLRSRKQQQRNLRVETRFVTEWTEIDPAILPGETQGGESRG